MKLRQDAREGAYRAKLLVGALALGAFLGALGWLHVVLLGGVGQDLPHLLRGAWTILTGARFADLRAEFLLSSLAGALVLGIPAAFLVFKKGVSSK